MPLRRYCPRWLSFPALVIGCVTPDAGYLFGEARGGTLSHGLLGSIVFCLPAGLLMLALFYSLRTPFVRMLPEPYRRSLLPLCRQPAGRPWTIAISLLIGVWTHLLWDSFTHTNGWVVQHVPVLSSQLAFVADRRVRVCHLLWYGCSFAGVVWLFAAFEKWKQASLSAGTGVRGKTVMRDAVLVAIAVVPIELVHHLVRLNKLGLCLLAVACGLLVMGIVLGVAKTQKHSAASKPIAGGSELD
jgi:hypothetical protein